MTKATSLGLLAAAFLTLVPEVGRAQIPALRADFNSNTVGEKPPGDLPGDPAGDSVLLTTTAGTITVETGFGVMTDQPLVMNRKTTGLFATGFYVRPGLDTCGSYTMRWTGMLTEDTDNIRMNFNADLGLLAQLGYDGNGTLVLNGFTALSVGFQPNVPQTFEFSFDFGTKKVSLSIDGVPVPKAQDVGFYDPLFATRFESAVFAMSGLEYEEYIIDDVAVDAFGCELPTLQTSWGTLKAQF